MIELPGLWNESLLKELRRVYPAKGGDASMLATDGWTDTVVRADYRQEKPDPITLSPR